ncbi:MAG: DEAD/DEAH box helicase [Legionellaceae bacterium]|nr:DEAD/DEAH box helicase [Legionellaceae bacterium]
MSFTSLGLAQPLIQAVTDLGYTQATPIQLQAIPAILQGRDILASAQTGTGKTAGFVLPVLQKTSQQARVGSNRIRVLILAPTRELAAQVHDSIVQYGQHLSLRSGVVFGGVKINPQMMKLRSGIDILVATPGRLLDLHQQRAVRFDEVDTLILDEADRMLDMGFIHDIKRIIKLLPTKRQNLLFSATFADAIRQLANSLLQDPLEITVAPRNTAATAVKQRLHPVDKSRKSALLSHLIHQHKWEQVLVFSKTKHGANKLVKQLAADRIYAAAIHGNKSQSQRTKILSEFKTGALHVLVATDIAARGLDIEALPCVINFDLPQVPEDYVHRIGRTARAGATGLALSLVCADEAPQLLAIEKLLKRKIERVFVDDFEPQHHVPEVLAHHATRKKTATAHKPFSRATDKAAKYRRAKS